MIDSIDEQCVWTEVKCKWSIVGWLVDSIWASSCDKSSPWNTSILWWCNANQVFPYGLPCVSIQ